MTPQHRPSRNHATRVRGRTWARGRGLVALGIAVVVVGAGFILLARPPADRLAAARVSPTASELTVALASGTAAVPTVPEPLSSEPPVAPPPTPPVAAGPFAAGVLVADEGNGRILALSNSGAIMWRFPASPSAIPAGQRFTADDAFLDPNGKSIVANDETHQVIDRIDIATGRITWQYGTYGRPGAGKGQLHTPDDAYPLANGDIVVADINNCRVIEIAPDKSIARQWGVTGVCRHRSGVTFNHPNGDTPLPDGGILITEIGGSRVVRLTAAGKVVFDIHVPVVYPSDAQLDRNGNVVVADYCALGQVVSVTPTGKLVWRYAPTSGPGRLNHTSLATPMPNGLVSINDDFRHRIVVIDPLSGKIVWQYGHTGRPGSKQGFLATPDGHQPLPPGIFG